MSDIFEVVLVVALKVLLVGVSLPYGSVVNFIFVGDRSDNFSEEWLLKVIHSIHNC